MTSSRVAAGPISRTSRGIPPQASGMPRSTSGIANRVVSAATRRSQAAASTRPPPTQWPRIAAMVTASAASTASAMRRPRSAVAGPSSEPAGPANSRRSKPAENARPRPDTTTTTAPATSSSPTARAISRSTVAPNGLSTSGWSSVSRPTPPSTVTSTVSYPSSVGTHRSCQRATTQQGCMAERREEHHTRPRDLNAGRRARRSRDGWAPHRRVSAPPWPSRLDAAAAHHADTSRRRARESSVRPHETEDPGASPAETSRPASPRRAGQTKQTRRVSPRRGEG